jgi:phospholipid-binding lipoprotein MlaA
MKTNFAAKIAAVAAITVMAAGCATPPPETDAEARAEYEQLNDPLEPMNRSVFEFNQGLDRAVIKPAAKGYRNIVPEFGRDRVEDFLTNLEEPLVFINDVLQGEVSRAGTTLGRFVLNSTFGVLGIMDVAEPMGLEGHGEDFGQTLAVWGVPEGPYLMLPLFGPSSPRDGIGMGVDMYVDPVGWWTGEVGADWASPTRTAVGGIDTREEYLEILDDIERSSLDYYASIRSMYRQNRQKEIQNQDAEVQ